MDATRTRPWKRLEGAPAKPLADARLQLHHAAQIPGALGNSVLAAEPDWAHVSLDWIEAAGALTSHATAGATPLRVGLALESFALVRLGGDGQVHDRFPLTGRTFAEGLSWAEAAVDAPLTPPTHEMPAHPVAEGAAFSLSPGLETAELARWFSNADRVLTTIDAPTRTWPHHFDMATLILLDPEKGTEESRSIGVGLSPGDATYAEPYWYVNPWPYPAPEALSPLPGGGAWHTEGWVGAVLTAENIAPGEQERQVEGFVGGAIEAARTLLS
jgi:hypothetical protein